MSHLGKRQLPPGMMALSANLEEYHRSRLMCLGNLRSPPKLPRITLPTPARGTRKECVYQNPQRFKVVSQLLSGQQRGLEVLQVGPDPPRETTGCQERAGCLGLGRGFLEGRAGRFHPAY